MFLYKYHWSTLIIYIWIYLVCDMLGCKTMNDWQIEKMSLSLASGFHLPRPRALPTQKKTRRSDRGSADGLTGRQPVTWDLTMEIHGIDSKKSFYACSWLSPTKGHQCHQHQSNSTPSLRPVVPAGNSPKPWHSMELHSSEAWRLNYLALSKNKMPMPIQNFDGDQWLLMLWS